MFNAPLDVAASGLGMLLVFWALAPYYVVLCEEGIIIVRGRQVGVHCWEDIASVDHRDVFCDHYYKAVYTLRVVAIRDGNLVLLKVPGNRHV
jgi:hypothetical protein